MGATDTQTKTVARQTTRFAITEHPRKPEKASVVVEAVNALDALDQYAVSHGYGRYSDLDDLHEFLGFDEYGLWAVYENVTLWAIPLTWSTEIARLTHEGLCVVVTRNGYTGQIFVQINTEDLGESDTDGNLEPFIEIMLDELVIYDHDKHKGLTVGASQDPGKERPMRDENNMQWLVGENDGSGYKYGVVANHVHGDTFELHGFFATYDDADDHRTYLKTAYVDYGHIKIVKIELPEVSS